MMEGKPAPNIYTFKDEKLPKFDTQYTSSIRDDHVPLIIDNGKLPVQFYFISISFCCSTPFQ